MSSLVRSRRALGIVVALIVAVASSVAYVVLTADPARAKEFATLRVLEGTVDVRTEGGSFAAAADGDTLREGDTVRTGRPGRAEIEYFDGSATRLDEGTTFTVVELSSDPEIPGNKVIRSEQASGTTLNRVVKLTDSQSRFDVETPTAVASVQGTKYAILVHPDGSTEYWVFDGLVVIVLPNGDTIELGAGDGVRLDPEGVPGEIFPVDPEDAATLCELDGTFCIETGDTVLGETVTREESEEPPATVVFEPTTATTTDTGGDDEPEDPEDPEDPDPPITDPGGGAPGSSIDEGPAGEQEQRSAAFAFSSDEPGSSFECSLDDEEYTPCDSPQEYDGLPDGEHVFRVRARDSADNTGPAQERRWVVSAPPETTIESGPEGTTEADTAVFRVSSDESDAVFECRIDEAEAFGECPTGAILTRSLSATGGAALDVVLTDLDEGDHTIRVQARDSTAKVDPTPSERSWSVALTPETTILTGPTGVTEASDATFTFSASLPGASFECALDDGAFDDCTSPKVYQNLVDGPHTFQVRATKNGRIDPSPAARNWRIGDPSAVTMTLTWVGPPRDLDLHVKTPTRQHVYHDNLSITGEDGPWIKLDFDERESSPQHPGVETVSIYPARAGFEPGEYTVYVVNYECEASFAASGAEMQIFGGGADASFAVSGASGQPSKDQWNVATITVQAGGATTLSEDQTLEGSRNCEEPSDPIDRVAAATAEAILTPPPAEDPPVTEAVRVERESGGIRIEWEPEDLEAEVRFAYGDEPPRAADEGEPACTGTGSCLVEGLDASQDAWFTVFPTGVDDLDPVEDVTSVRLRALEHGEDGGTGGDAGDGGSETEQPSEPGSSPEPEPEPGIVDEEQPADEEEEEEPESGDSPEGEGTEPDAPEAG